MIGLDGKLDLCMSKRDEMKRKYLTCLDDDRGRCEWGCKLPGPILPSCGPGAETGYPGLGRGRITENPRRPIASHQRWRNLSGDIRHSPAAHISPLMFPADAPRKQLPKACAPLAPNLIATANHMPTNFITVIILLVATPYLLRWRL